MKIDPNEIKLPLKKTVQTFNGDIEVSLSAMDSKEAGIYKSYMSSCAMDDKMFINTAGMDKTQTMNTCANYYGQVEKMLNEESTAGGLTPAQKKLPPALQQAILKKMGKGNPDGEKKEESAKAKVATKAQMMDEEDDESIDDETDEYGMKAKKTKATEKTKLLSKKDEAPTDPACESLKVVKAAEIEKEVSDTCEK